MIDSRLADAMLAVGIVTEEQAVALRDELQRISDEDWGEETVEERQPADPV